MHENRAIVAIEEDERGELSLAREMTAAFKEYVAFYQEQMGKTVEEAIALAEDPADDDFLDMMHKQPPEQLSWLAFNALAERDPALARQEWRRLVNMARDELESGHRAAQAVEGFSHRPWDRARFLALRESLAKEWGPGNGVEWLLVDMLAQAYTLYEEAMRHTMLLTTTEAYLDRSSVRERERWKPQRNQPDDVIDRAKADVDRYHRIVMRVQRALRDQRRYGAVVVQHAGQVNVGQQQVNVARAAGEEEREGAVRPARRARAPRVRAAQESDG